MFIRSQERQLKTLLYFADPNLRHWGWGENDTPRSQRFNLQKSATYGATLRYLPLHNFSDSSHVVPYIESQKFLSRYAFGTGLLLAGGFTVFFGFSPVIFLPLAIGAFVSGFSSTRLYYGTKKNKLRWIISSFFLGKKSRKTIKGHQEKMERFDFLKESYEMLVNLTLQEVESDNLLNIANTEPDAKGNYIAFLEHGEFARVDETRYRELRIKSIKLKPKEEVLQITHQMIENKFKSLKFRELGE